ncbi:MAG: FAD-binding oxidoreductase, partial [Pseudomonadota bacterium]
QRAELGTDAYHGGVVHPRHASLHPARYHRGLLDAALGAGAQVVGHCAALSIDRDGAAFDVRTERGRVRARDVIVATNGYTDRLSPWLQRRVVPIGSYIIATEPLPPALVAQLFPRNRIASDTRKVVYYYRVSPDRRRVIFGGRVSAGETDPSVSGPRLYADMCAIFPELRDWRVTHSWMGTVAYSFDELAHAGLQDGVRHALCYCGSGVSMASYLGMRLGRQVLGLADGATAFDGLPFPTRPLYRGRPWFLPAVVAWYRWRDRARPAQGRRAA